MGLKLEEVEKDLNVPEGAAMSTSVASTGGLSKPIEPDMIKKSADKQTYTAFKNEGVAARGNYTEEERAFEGSKSDTLEFVTCLCDPSRKTNRRKNKQDISSYEIVGFKFRALEAMQVPSCPLKPDYKTIFDGGERTYYQVEANTEFSLNLYETGLLLSRPEFAGAIKGYGREVRLGMKVTSDRPEPRPCLAMDKKGDTTIKDYQQFISEATPTPTGGKVWKVKDEFADIFGVIVNRKATASRTKKNDGAKPTPSSYDIAAAFRCYDSKRYGG